MTSATLAHGISEEEPRRSSDRLLDDFSTEPLGYVDSLDGLRGYSMVVVMFYHAKFTFFPGGFLAVSIFFTLSGFLITSLLLREWAGQRSVDMRAFWSRRFRRLLPAAWVTLAGVIVLGLLGAWNGDQRVSLRGDIPSSLFQVVNWHFILEQRTYGSSFVAPSPVEHYWSLAVEEQFYLFLPLIVLGILTLGRRRSFSQNVRRVAGVLLGLIVLGAALNGLLARNSIDRAYFGSDTRMPEMLAGALLACVMVRRLRFPTGRTKTLLRALGVVGLFGILALWMFGALRVQWMYPWGLLATSAATCAVIAGSLQGGVAANILAWKPAARLGRMSYGTYLVHWPIFLILTPARVGWAPWPLFALRFVVSVTVSTLMFYLVEEPVRRRRALTGPRFLFSGALLLPLLLIGTLVMTRGAEPTSVIQRDPTGNANKALPGIPTKRILFVGDQSATTLALSLDGMTSSTPAKFRFRALAASVDDCGLVSGGWVLLDDGRVERDVERCVGAVDTWTERITTDRPDLVVVIPASRDAAIRRADSSTPWESPAVSEGNDFRSVEVGTTLDSLAEAARSAASAIVVASSPFTTGDPPAALPPRKPLDDPDREAMATVEEAQMIRSAQALERPSAATRVAAFNQIIPAVAATRGVEFVDLQTALGTILGSDAPLDTTAAGSGLPSVDRPKLADWFAGIVRTRADQPPTSIPVPEDLSNNEIPPAPPVTPRLVAPSDKKATVLVMGDSLAYGLGFGLKEWAGDQQVDVTVGAQFGCPIARGGRFRFQRDTASFDPSCDWGANYPQLASDIRPEVVALSSSVWQVVDRQLPGDTRYRHMGDELMDRYVLSEFLRAVDALASKGATVALLTSPHIESGQEKGFSGLAESDPARMDRLNEIVRQAAELRPGVTRLIDLQGWLASQDGREMDPSRRPDGIHFTDKEARSIADWLGPQLEAIARGR